MSQQAATDRIMQGVSSNSPLPPSVEAAYYRKCIVLKRRIEEIEQNNDTMRQRKDRITRAIQKLRLERAFLLDALTRQMEQNVDDSDKSTTPPPTPQPQDKPMRSKRGHRKQAATPPPAPSATDRAAASPSAQASAGTPQDSGTAANQKDASNADEAAPVNGSPSTTTKKGGSTVGGGSASAAAVADKAETSADDAAEENGAPVEAAADKKELVENGSGGDIVMGEATPEAGNGDSQAAAGGFTAVNSSR